MSEEMEISAQDANFYFRIKNRSKNFITLTFANNEPFVTLGVDKSISVDGHYILNNKWFLDQIQLQERQGLLDVRKLNLQVGASYVIHNMTARRIGIKHYSLDEDLILPPFGNRELTSEFLKSYDYLPWERQSLIKIEPAGMKKKNDTVIAGIKILIALFFIFLMVSIPLEIFVHNSITWQAIGWVSGIFLVVLAVTIYVAKKVTYVGDIGIRNETLDNWLQLTPGIALVLVCGIGLPFAAVYFFGDGQQLFVLADRSLGTLGRLMQTAFISVAAMLPAMLYYLFGRLQIEKLRNNFFREAMQLDPDVQSFSEAENKYDPLLDSVFGNGNSPFAILLLVITTAMLVMGWIIVLDPVGPATKLTTLISFFTPHPTTFNLAFLGTYFFAINMVFRRYVRSDLTPKTYAYIVVRMLITLALVWAVSTLPQFAQDATSTSPVVVVSPLVNSGLMAVAFIIGVFPDTGLALISDFVKGITKNVFKGEKADPFPLSDLEGMNLYDRTRLLEEGIENIENLAHHDLMELIARTRIPTQRVVDMFDQSLLYIHMGINANLVADQAPNANPGAEPAPTADQDQGYALLALLKSFGIRTASDLVYAFDHKSINLGNIELALADRSGVIPRLKVIADAIKDEDMLDDICNWYNLSVTTITVTDPYKFYKTEIMNKPAPVHVEPEPDSPPSSNSPVVEAAQNEKNLAEAQLEAHA